MIRSRFTVPFLVALLSPIVLACDASLPTSPASTVVLDRASNHAVSRPRLAVCPSQTTESVSAEIGPDGGTLSLSGHSLAIPAGAVSRPTQFTLTAPAGPYLQVLVTAQTTEPSHFQAPAAVTISYERCKRQNLNPTSGAILSPQVRANSIVTALDGETDARGRTLTFEVDLSSENGELFVARGIYAVAY